MKIPKGYEHPVWKKGMKIGADWMFIGGYGQVAPTAFAGHTYRKCDYLDKDYIRPISKPISKPYPSKCKHERHYYGCTFWNRPFRWCRECGAFYHPTRKKWLKARS